MNTGPADIDIELLEPLLQRFVQLIGLPKTMIVVEHCGGAPLYIASDPSPDGQLARLIGLDAAATLGREFGGDRPAIPKAGAALRALRDRSIRADHATKSIRQLVQAYSLSERRICEILAAEPADVGPGLFD